MQFTVSAIALSTHQYRYMLEDIQIVVFGAWDSFGQ